MGEPVADRSGASRVPDRAPGSRGDLTSADALLADACRADVEGRVILGAIRDDSGSIVDLECLEATPAACALLGRSRGQLVGRRWLDVFHEALSDGLFDECVRVVETGRPILPEQHLVTVPPSTGERHVDLRIVRVADGVSLALRDVTDRVEADKHLVDSDRVEADRRIAASEAQLRLLTENMHDVVVMADADFVVTYCSPSVTALLGWVPEDLVGRPSHHLLHPDDLAAMTADPQPVPIESSGGSICPARVRGRDGSYRWIESASKWVLSSSGETLGFTSTWRDIHDRVAAEAELDRRARVDFLTGLANRSEIIDSISRIGGQSDRAASAVAVLFCDIDHFKDINDEYGHAAGDEVLRVVSERIRAVIRHGDRAGRMGGDEILVVLEGVRTLVDATAIAEKIRRTASQRIALAAGDWVAPTLSIGVTILLPSESVDAVIARADGAMYVAKESGRDRVIAVGGP